MCSRCDEAVEKIRELKRAIAGLSGGYGALPPTLQLAALREIGDRVTATMKPDVPVEGWLPMLAAFHLLADAALMAAQLGGSPSGVSVHAVEWRGSAPDEAPTAPGKEA